ncbi:CRISPR-associated helicase/endonuclease Cas3 [Methanosarcina mazei]|uniref:Phosphohydrolase n=1 Tax=Methanosarcina mazei TaxID=2209 RepID=A0A0F8HQF5_METMZ|nr:CRISPR-associated helicase/endonuclease Cas3 [Methanosarcina mazei]KKG69159.1 phosphohydrolase [Methanosarcina mazei]KKG84139.1 phosphohydrolase [Methanosarcina mazei]KKH12505.1 phosphohydrolase [Methanosarcina mazei]KKH12772.1 phosphohydrolase [Methanosarcina mazei]KKH64863.1 phosphohydrolase [Methanosarcina mazei]
MYYAHSTDRQDKYDWQFLKDHLENVADIASGFSREFNAKEFGYSAGLLHDIGKYSPEFQRRLDGAKIRVDHSTAGALEAKKLYGIFQSRILEYVITGHHGGLLNYGTKECGLDERLSRPVLSDYSAYKNEISAPDLSKVRPSLTPINNKLGFAISFYIRMLFSCLVDADFLDTERFLSPDKSSLRGQYEPFDDLFLKFDNYMKAKLSTSEENPINRYRREIYEQCIEKAELPPQIFSLTVPTGGGKTLSSMAFALDHLRKHNLNRILYVIPYTSIIEQNADIFREIFGNKNVLEHHSNYDPKNEKSESTDLLQEKLKLSSENWDIPIIITTNVQFFESLFSNRVSRCRKLHNLAKSVIILDEAQMLPTGFLKPCLSALSELVVNYGSTVVICTATQPNLNGLLDENIKPVEITRSPQELYEAFRRVHVTDLGDIDDSDLSARLNAHKQALCIVNTRKHAQKLYEQLSESESCYHLSARMCPVHRRMKLKKIKNLLKEGAECRVISTQLIEAGVDIDFPAVYRTISGIDSVCQASGRCNREGKMASGEVYVFRSTEDYGKATHWQSRVAEIGSMIFDEWDDPLSLPAVDSYFEKLYSYEGDKLDKKRILPSFEERLRDVAFPFEDVADAFNLIGNDTRDIIIPYDDKARSIIKQMQQTGFPGKYARNLQGYTVSIYVEEFKALERNNAISSIADRFFVLNKLKDYYSEDTGLLNRKYNGEDLLLIA